MDMLKLFSRFAALVIVFSIAIPVQAADDIQDANKLFKQGQYAKAMEKVDAFLATKPKDAQARFLKGLILTEQGNTADAIGTFAGITEDYPELPEPYNNLAVLYAGQGQYEKAKSALEMAIRTNPNYSTAYENLGDIYAMMASQAYGRALQLDKNNSSAKIKLALVRDLLSKNARTTAKPAAAAAAATAPTTAAPVAASGATATTPLAAPVAASGVVATTPLVAPVATSGAAATAPLAAAAPAAAAPSLRPDK
jgi:tetratricopeptide (TPR) repeat protein